MTRFPKPIMLLTLVILWCLIRLTSAGDTTEASSTTSQPSALKNETSDLVEEQKRLEMAAGLQHIYKLMKKLREAKEKRGITDKTKSKHDRDHDQDLVSVYPIPPPTGAESKGKGIRPPRFMKRRQLRKKKKQQLRLKRRWRKMFRKFWQWFVESQFFRQKSLKRKRVRNQKKRRNWRKQRIPSFHDIFPTLQ